MVSMEGEAVGADVIELRQEALMFIEQLRNLKHWEVASHQREVLALLFMAACSVLSPSRRTTT